MLKDFSGNNRMFISLDLSIHDQSYGKFPFCANWFFQKEGFDRSLSKQLTTQLI